MDYSGFEEVQIFVRIADINEHLSNGWEILEIFKNKDEVLFYLGRRYYVSSEELSIDCGSEGTD